MPLRKILGLTILTILLAAKGYSQQDDYLFHEGGVASPQRTYKGPTKRAWKTSIDAGLVFSFASPSTYFSNYANSFSGSTGYTFGVIEEIPVHLHSYIEVGAEILQDGVSFNSYFFAPGYSFLYNGQETYNHVISMNELQFPILYKFRLGPADLKRRSLYATVGGKFRYISYTNSAVTDNNTGDLVWEGQRDVAPYYKLFSPFGSPIFEMSLGYQRDTQNKRKRGWYMNLEYDYGITPLHYTGNMEGSNDVVFHLNTIVFKIGKIF